MIRILLILVFILPANVSASIWETSCERCHGSIAPSKEKLLLRYQTPEDMLNAANKAVKGGKMPQNQNLGFAVDEIFASLLSTHAKAKASMPSLPPIPLTDTLSATKVFLGKMLYYDPRLSSSKTVSCNNCHNLSLHGSSASYVNGINPPSTLNVGFEKLLGWNGNWYSIEEAVNDMIKNQMDENPKELVDRLSQIPEYAALFRETFGNDGNTINYNDVIKAISTFLRTLNTPNSPFNRYMAGDGNALSDEQKQGMRLFKVFGCEKCHSGFTFSDGKLHQFKNTTYKTPSLLNVSATSPYFHNGSTDNLVEAIKIMGKTMLNIDINDVQAWRIKQFLESLKGSVPIQARVLPELPDESQ